MMVSSPISNPYQWLPYPYMIVIAIIVMVVAISLCTFCFGTNDKDKDDRGRKSGLSMLDYNARHNPYTPVDRGSTISLSSNSPPLSPLEEKKVQPSLGSMDDLHPYGLYHSAYPEIPEPPENIHKASDLGNLYFTLRYLSFKQVLDVTVQKATNLPAKDLNGLSDPYVSVSLLPDKSQKLLTQVRKRKLNPVWNEVLCFEGFAHHKLQQRTLHMKVFDHDTLTRDDEIGEIRLPLSDVALLPEPVPFIKKLQPCKGHRCEYRGHLLLSLCYIPTNNCMEVIVMKCHNLKLNAGNFEILVKVALVRGGEKLDRKRTTQQQKSCNPVWNETMEFEVSFSQKRDVSMVFKAVGKSGGLHRDVLLGRVVVGCQTNTSTQNHWTDVLSSPRKAIAMWHSIVQ